MMDLGRVRVELGIKKVELSSEYGFPRQWGQIAEVGSGSGTNYVGFYSDFGSITIV